MVTRADIVSEARSWINTPWRHQGRSRSGVDCVGLVVMVCKGLGISDYDSTTYGRDPDARKFLSHFTAGGATRINPQNAQVGDLLIFHQSGFPCHSGIRSAIGDEPSVIHAHMQRRMVKEERLVGDVPLVAVFRLPGVED